jgi:serine/threonine protein kinase
VLTMADAQWTCAKCTLKNKQADSRCTACQAPKPVRSLFVKPPGPWECQECTYENSEGTSKCSICGSNTPPLEVIDFQFLTEKVASYLTPFAEIAPIADRFAEITLLTEDAAMETKRFTDEARFDNLASAFREACSQKSVLLTRAYEAACDFADVQESEALQTAREDCIRIAETTTQALDNLLSAQHTRIEKLGQFAQNVSRSLQDISTKLSESGFKQVKRGDDDFATWWALNSARLNEQYQRYRACANRQQRAGLLKDVLDTPADVEEKDNMSPSSSSSGSSPSAGTAPPPLSYADRRDRLLRNKAEINELIALLESGLGRIASTIVVARETKAKLEKEKADVERETNTTLWLQSRTQQIVEEVRASDPEEERRERENRRRQGVLQRAQQAHKILNKMRVEYETLCLRAKSDPLSVTNADLEAAQRVIQQQEELLQKADTEGDSQMRITASGFISEQIEVLGVVIPANLAAYEHVEELHAAKGAMRAHHVARKRIRCVDCALHEYEISGREEAALRARFENNILNRSGLQHSSIDPPIAVFEADSSLCYIQLPFHPKNLDEWMRQGPKPWEIQSLFYQLALGIAYLHRSGVVHGDLCAKAVLVSSRNTPIISSFDRSYHYSHALHLTTVRAGTPEPNVPYPEKERSPAQDVYALGLLLRKANYLDTQFSQDPSAAEFLPVAERGPPHVSRLCELLRVILCVNPHNRLGIDDVLSHPYFTQPLAQDLQNARQILRVGQSAEALIKAIHTIGHVPGETPLRLKREDVVKTVLKKFAPAKRNDLLKPTKVNYTDFASQDDGGLTRDLFTEFFLKIVDPDEGLFECAEAGSQPYIGPSYLPVCNSRHSQETYQTIGKMMVKALVEKRPLPIRFAPSVYKFLIQGAGGGQSDSELEGVVAPTLDDLSLYDRIQAKTFRELLRMKGVEQTCFLDFAGLLPNGAAIAVTDDNKHTYVDLKVKSILLTSREQELSALREGFYTIDLRDALRQCSPEDIMELIGAYESLRPEHIIHELKFMGFDVRSPTPDLLKEALMAFPKDHRDLRKFLRLTTAQCSIPRGGLNPKITVQCTFNTAKLPVGHTCTHTLDLPDYQHEGLLRSKLQLALDSVDSVGFDYV